MEPQPQRPTSNASTHIDPLTGVRGIAALWVVLYHLGDLIEATWPAWRFTNQLIAGGYLGVDLFSLLSGFVIAHRYAEIFAAGGVANRRFLWLRVVRTLPLHLFVMAMFVLMVPVEGDRTLGQLASDGSFWRQLLLLHGIGFEDRFAWNVPSWSLGSEWACYLVFPLLAPLIARVRHAGAALACAAITLLGTALLLQAVGHRAFDAYLDYGWLRVGGEFLTGCWLQRVHQSGALARWPLGWIALVLLGVMILARGFFGWYTLAAWYVGGFALWILALAQNRRPWRALLGNPVMHYLGEISYSLYMVHWWVLVHGERFGLRALPKEAQVIALLVAVLLLSSATYHGIERTAQRRLRNRFGT